MIGRQEVNPAGQWEKSPMAKQGAIRAAFACRLWHGIAHNFYAVHQARISSKQHIAQVARTPL